MFRHRFGPLGSAGLSALLSVMLLGVSGSLAANTRVIYFGSPQADCSAGICGSGGSVNGTSLTSGTLVFSPVTVSADPAHPGRTAVQFVIANLGGQTLNHVKFAGGTVADNLPYNSTFTVDGTNLHPAGPSWPGNVTFNNVFPSAGCTPSTDGTGSTVGILCDVGTLTAAGTAGASKTYILFFTPPQVATTTALPLWLTASWNEGWSSTGTNADYAFAKGGITVGTAGCSTATSSYFLPAEVVSLLSDAGACTQAQTANVGSGKALDPKGYGTFAQVGVDTNTAADWCPTAGPAAGVTCFGSTVSVQILGGDPVPGGVLWTVTWFGTKSMGGVIHFWDTYDPSNPAHSSDYTVIPFSKQFQCSAKLTSDCWTVLSNSKGNTSPSWFQATFITLHNGKSGGFF